MLGEPDTWHALMTALTDVTIAFLTSRSSTRASTPSRCSTRGPGRCRWPTTAPTCCRTAPGCSRRWPVPGVPMTHFGVGTAELLGAMSEAVAPAASPVVGVDWRTSLTDAAARVRAGHRPAGQPRSGRAAGGPAGGRARGPRGRRGRASCGRRGRRGSRVQLGSRGAAGNRPRCHHRSRGIGALAVSRAREKGIVLRCRRRYFGTRRRLPAARHARRRRGHHRVRARRPARRRAAHRTGRRPADRRRRRSVRRPPPRGARVARRAGPGRQADRHDGRAAR